MPTPLPPFWAPVYCKQRERGDYLPEFRRAEAENMPESACNPYLRFPGIQSHDDPRLHGAPRDWKSCYFHQNHVRHIACRAAPSIGMLKISEQQWGGSHGNPLITLSRVRPNVKWGEEAFAAGSARA